MRRNFTCAVPEPPKSLWTGFETTQDALQQKALGFNCLNYNESPEPSLGRHFLPNKTFLDQFCTNGLRTEVMFPSCWDGKSFQDIHDQSSHLTFPSLVMTGNCPAGWDLRLPSLFYETIWGTEQYIGRQGQFLFSQGDPTGYGYHGRVTILYTCKLILLTHDIGDFMEGWQPDFLQQAVDTCTSLSGMLEDCPLFDLNPVNAMETCKFQVPVQAKAEAVVGPLKSLPGNNPVQTGPDPAAPSLPLNRTSLVPAPTPPAQALVLSTDSLGLRMIPAPTMLFRTQVNDSVRALKRMPSSPNSSKTTRVWGWMSPTQRQSLRTDGPSTAKRYFSRHMRFHETHVALKHRHRDFLMQRA